MASTDPTDPESGYYGAMAAGQFGPANPAQPGAFGPTGVPVPTGPYYQPGTNVNDPANAAAAAAAANPVTGLNIGQPDPNAGGPGTGTAGPLTPGKGLFDPALYTPFTGTPPSYVPPTLPNPPQWKAPPAFSYADFQAPTLAEAQNQPGYQFGVQQGEQALQQSRAAQGVLRTGGTLKDILNYGQQAATQNYGNVLNQDLGIYNTNRAGAVQAYNTNYQTQYVDPYQAQILPYQTMAANAQHVADQNYNSAENAFTNSADIFYNNQNAPYAKLLSLAQLGAANA
jgi:hypothetical protein